MKNESKFLKLVLVGVLGAAAMIGCGGDANAGNYPVGRYASNGCTSVFNEKTEIYDDVCDGVCVDVTDEVTEEVSTQCSAPSSIPEEDSTTTSEDPTTTVEETTTTVEETTTTVPRPTTTVKKTTAATAPPTTRAAETTTVPPTTAPPTTAPPTTQAPTTAPPTTLPPVNVTAQWSGLGEGCPENHDLYLDVNVYGATSAGTLSVRVGGSAVTSYGGSNFGIGDTTMILFDQWPSLDPGAYTVTITATSATQGPTTVTKRVTYNCPP